jgi:hypothetical protein
LWGQALVGVAMHENYFPTDAARLMKYGESDSVRIAEKGGTGLLKSVRFRGLEESNETRSAIDRIGFPVAAIRPARYRFDLLPSS